MLIGRGLAALERAEELGGGLGPYALQASIAACHARARVAEDTNWPRILALYDALAELSPSPVVDLNRAVALGMAFGPERALEVVDELAARAALEGYHLLPSVRGDLLFKLGRLAGGAGGVRARGVAHRQRARAQAAARARRGLRRATAAQSDSGPGIRRHVDGVLLERLERHELERALVRRRQHDVGRDAVLVGAPPVERGHAPAVAGHQPREAVLRHRRRQVVADAALVLEELRRHDRADRVAADVLDAAAAATVPVEAGDRIAAAGLELAAEDVALTHRSSAFFASTSIPCSRARFSPRILRLDCSVSCG